MNVAIIPARGGSKRIPRKNIRDFCGKPIISYSIEAALQSDLFDRVYVSTDDDEIANVAESLGAEIPFLRPNNLANDFATTTEVMEHAASFLNDKFKPINTICCIYATSPFIQINDLKLGMSSFNEGKWDYIFSATSFPFPIQRAIKKVKGSGIKMFQPEHFLTRSQDLEDAYHDAGQFYFGTPKAWTAKLKIFQENSQIVLLPRWRVQDIDTEEDWKTAEILYKSFIL